MSLEHLLAKITPVERTVTVCLRGDLGEELDQARSDLAAAIIAAESDADITGGEARKLAEHMAELEARVDEVSETFRVRSLGARSWKLLVGQHPPRDDDLRWDQETFPVAAIAACIILPDETDPTMTLDEAGALADALSEYQWDKLFAAVCLANMGDDLVPKSGVGSLLTHSSEPTSDMPPSMESPSLSS